MAATTQSTFLTTNPPSTGLRQLWQTLTTPAVSLQGEERRQTQLLLALLAVGVPLAYLCGALGIILELFFQNERAVGTIVLSTTFPLALTVIYAVARTDQARLAMRALVVLPTLVILLSTVPFSPQDNDDFFLYFLSLGVVFASLLLDQRGTTVIAVINLVTIGLMLALIPTWDFVLVTDELVFNLFVPALLIVSASVRGRFIADIRTQIAVAEAAQATAEAAQHAEAEARQQAETASQVKSAFLASMSHELRTPLNSIINFSKFLERGMMGPVNDDQTETLREIIDNSEHLLGLINDVLDMSKIESGSLKLFVEDDVDLNELMNTVIASARALIGEKPVTLRAHIDDALPKMLGDRQRLLQIMLNIVSNACKFTEKGEVEITATVSGEGQIQIAVRDTGPGIAAGDREAVFEAFKQTSAGLRKGGGTGLGMPITRSLVEAHDGRIGFESTVGQGTTFYVTLPIRSDNLKATL
jgi:signal transduction histidine kinase